MGATRREGKRKRTLAAGADKPERYRASRRLSGGRFIDLIHDDIRKTQAQGRRIRLQQATPAQLPKVLEAA